MGLRFHWMLPKAGEVTATRTPLEARRYRVAAVADDSPARHPDFGGWLQWARRAEDAGIDSTLVCFNRYEPDPFIVASALGMATTKLRFILAYRSGLMQPPTFVQQVNTLSGFTGGRVAVNLVAGSSSAEQRGYGDFLSHDERYARAEEFLAVCNAFWQNERDVDFDGRHYRVQGGRVHTPFVGASVPRWLGASVPRSSSDGTRRNAQNTPEAQARRAEAQARSAEAQAHSAEAQARSAEAPSHRPAIYISGHSDQALQLVKTQGTCWLRTADLPERIAPAVREMREAGLSVCLRVCVICRPTYDEALAVAESLLADAAGDGIAGTADDSRMYDERAREAAWLSRTLWTGLVPKYGPVWTTLLGTPRDLADAFLAWGEIGVDEFILSGWPELETMDTFGREVIPLIREAEQRADRAAMHTTDATSPLVDAVAEEAFS
jgi:alkanesulfonate monooxygenase